MYENARRHLNPCNAFIENWAAKIKELTGVVLRRGNCTDPDNHAQSR